MFTLYNEQNKARDCTSDRCGSTSTYQRGSIPHSQAEITLSWQLSQSSL
ncbi:hypothetical protein H6G35_20835 [Aulosira sp. FACHB-113]|nr:hypothetical protein [Aulosira sp. FACHB-113]